MRYKAFKFNFSTQTRDGIGSWFFAQEIRKAPLIIDLRADPYERAMQPGPTGRSNSIGYDQWAAERMWALVPAQSIVAKFLGTFKEYPPAQKPGSFSVGDALKTLQTASQGK